MSQDRTVGSRAPVLRARVSRCHNTCTQHAVWPGHQGGRRKEENGELLGRRVSCILKDQQKSPQKAPEEEPTDKGSRDVWRTTCSWYHDRSRAGQRA